MTVKEHGVRHTWGLKVPGESNNHRDIRGECVWNKLYAKGVTVDAVNLPVTYPASHVRPRFVSGYQQAGKYVKAPSDLELPEDYLQWSDMIWWTSEKPEECPGWIGRTKDKYAKAELLNRAEQLAWSLVEWYVGTHEGAGLGMLGFTYHDRALHVWNEDDVYRWSGDLTQRIVEEVCNALQPEHTLIVSDHGFHALGHHPWAAVGYKDFPFDIKDGEWATEDKPQWTGMCTWLVAPLIARLFGFELVPPGEPDYTIEDKMVVEQRMRDLGYIE
jgi:hypothetical protein